MENEYFEIVLWCTIPLLALIAIIKYAIRYLKAKKKPKRDLVKLALEKAAIPKGAIEFRRLVSLLPSTLDLDAFYNGSHLDKSELLSKTANSPKDNLADWIESQPGEQKQMYWDFYMQYFRAYESLDFRENGHTEKAIISYTYMRNWLKDAIYIDNDPETAKRFQPIVDSLNSRIEEKLTDERQILELTKLRREVLWHKDIRFWGKVVVTILTIYATFFAYTKITFYGKTPKAQSNPIVDTPQQK